ncbi:hypothetical protein MYVA_2225 [Mycolicibacterium vaccae 95051]|nr:hypothetical protein MYVA_2225 [Mycolicibacterium vaccae 95051]
MRKPHATDDRGLHVLVFGPFRALRLTSALRGTTGTAEGACGTAALAGAATAATGATAESACGCSAAGTCAATAVVTAAAATAAAGPSDTTGCGTWATAGSGPATGAGSLAGTGALRTRRHVAGRRAGSRSTAGTGATGAGSGPGAARAGRALRPGSRPLDGLLGREGVIADARCARGRLRGAGPWAAGARTRSGSRGGGPGGGLFGCGRGCLRSCRGGCRGRCRRLRRCGRSRGRRRSRRGSGLLRYRRAGLGTGTVLRGGRLRRDTCRAVAAGRCGGLVGLVSTERFTQPTSDGGFHRRGRRLDEFALLTEPGENLLTCDTEFLSQLVHAGLTCHYISCLGGDSGGRRRASV